MTQDSGAVTVRYNERSQTRASIVTRWLLLVPGCASPVLAALWNMLSVPEITGVAAGVATWTWLMIRFHVWRLLAGEYGETTRLTESAALFMVVQWLLVAFAPRGAVFVVYIPAVVGSSYLTIPRLEVPDYGITFLLTMACGANALAYTWAFSWAAGRLSHHMNGPR